MKNKGITLIALVVTIIVLIILVGVSINLVLGENGVIQRAKLSAIYARKAQAEEYLQMSIADIQIQKEGNALLQDILNEFKQVERTDIEVINVETEKIGYISNVITELPVGKVKEITVIIDEYREFTFTIGEECKITKVCGIEIEEWKGETTETPVEDKTKITIKATPENQTQNGINKQKVNIEVSSTKGWENWSGQYGWNTSSTNAPTGEQWKSLTLQEKNETEKIGEVEKTANENGEYYLWIKIATCGKTVTQKKGPYKLEAIPTEDNLTCIMGQKKENETIGILTVGSNKNFEGWECTYTVVRNQETIDSGNIEGGTTTTTEVRQGDLVTVIYSKTGYTDVIKILNVTELKIAYTLIYNATEGSGAPSNIPVQYSSTGSSEFEVTSSIPTRSGYNFVGWTVNPDRTGTVIVSGGKITVTQPETTLYAKWRAFVQITYDGNGGTYNSSTTVVESASQNSTITLRQNQFTRTMYEFVCWTLPDGTEYNAGTNYNIGESPITFTAKWKSKISREMNYLVTTGNQYIDTGFIPNQDTTIEMKVQLLSRKGQSLWGAREEFSKNAYSLWYVSSDESKEGFRSDYNTELYYSMDSLISSYEARIIKQDKNKIYIDGNLKNTNTYSNFSSGCKLYLFNLNNNGTIFNNTYCTEMKFYYCKIWDNGTLIRDYIPVIDNNNKVCIFDRVSNDFCTISYGNVQEEFKSDTEFIEAPVISTGTQYLNTEITPSNNTKVIMKFRPNENGGAVYGSRTSGTEKTFTVWLTAGGSFRFDYNTNMNTATTYSIGTIYEIEQANGYYKIGNNTTNVTAGNFTGNNNLYLFALNNNGSLGYNSKITLYSCKIYNGTTLVRDYVPTLNSINIPCLYDRVSGQYYRTSGNDLQLSK